VRSLVAIALAAVQMLMAGIAAAEVGRAPDAAQEAVAEPLPQAPSGPNPVQLERTLQLMQDQIAIGSTEAHMGQRGLLGILDDKFMSMEPEVWKTGKNVRAAVSFVLGGGNPAILRKLLEIGSEVLAEGDRPLVEGALAYVEGREEAAQNALASVEPGALPPVLGAQLALAQSALMVRKDPAKSDELLDFVRLQAPGTLLEEAALRRQVFIASQTNNLAKFQLLATDYLRRYRHSVYAGNFRQRLASALTRIDFGKESARFDGIVAMMSELEPDARKDLYLMAARASVEHGLTTSARMLADKAQELSGQDAASSTRARLYRSAAMIVLPAQFAGAVDELRKLDRALLAGSDLTLLDAALAMANQIHDLPGKQASQVVAAQSAARSEVPETSSKTPVAAQGSEQLQALSKARDALSRVDKLIKNQASVTQ
jgi:chemotaxis protein MotC